jgi:hypothetical protein
MKKNTKIIVGVVAVAAVGVAGYFGYKKYQESKEPAVSGLGAFSDGGYADYNTHVAARYWQRLNQQYNERLRLQAMRGY